ncbi:MAG: Asp-tRNA(Asn)/Glu-tRNA(Gln) amidotransferase subunit GatB, partial [Planctomycetota bacterium]
RILRAHLEEDAGKSVHDDPSARGDSLIDLNRTGTPLLEIVSEPDLRSAAEAKAYLTELKLLLTYLGVSDCNMQEGSLRCDANVNLHIDAGGEKVATPIVEIKNLNSFRGVERAIEYEAERQFRAWKETGRRLGDTPKQTRGWDDAAGKTTPQREKEESSDYRYFPDPDLAPVRVSRDEVRRAEASLGELPAALRARLETEHKLTAYDADVIVNQGRALVDYFFAVAQQTGDSKATANWITQDVLRSLKASESRFADWSMPPEHLAGLIMKLASGELPRPRGREAFDLMAAGGMGVDEAMAELGVESVDESDLETLCRELLDANPRIVADVRAGKQQAVGALIGQAKKQNPNVDPGRIRQLCLDLIGQGAGSPDEAD